MPSSAPDFLDFRKDARAFSSLSGVDNQPMNLTGGSEPERVQAARVSATFWSLLGVQPAIGRGFAPNEDAQSAGQVVVLSDGLWKRRFGGDRRVVGKTIALDGNTYTVIGVAAPRFSFPDRPDVWVPLVFSTDELNPSNRGGHWMGIIGRLAPDVTVAQANAELVAVTRRLEQQYPQSNTGCRARSSRCRSTWWATCDPALYTMLGAVAFVLLIACANVANLLLVRAGLTRVGDGRTHRARRRVLAHRRQLVTESVLLAVVGGIAGRCSPSGVWICCSRWRRPACPVSTRCR
jgi:hypothetical protein